MSEDQERRPTSVNPASSPPVSSVSRSSVSPLSLPPPPTDEIDADWGGEAAGQSSKVAPKAASTAANAASIAPPASAAPKRCRWRPKRMKSTPIGAPTPTARARKVAEILASVPKPPAAPSSPAPASTPCRRRQTVVTCLGPRCSQVVRSAGGSQGVDSSSRDQGIGACQQTSTPPLGIKASPLPARSRHLRWGSKHHRRPARRQRLSKGR